MTKKRSTKRALLMSALSLLMCVSMLIGSTFAWFTDEVTSGKNQIVAGNLDVELRYNKVINGAFAGWKTAADAEDIFDPNALWEPGRVEVVYLEVANLGTLALKYQLGVNISRETPGTNVYDEEFYLSSFLKFKVVPLDAEPTAPYTDREAAAQMTADVTGLKDYNGTTTALLAEKKHYVALIVYMPETVGNEANYKAGSAVPTIELGVNLYATQYTNESDSYGSDYDENAWNEKFKVYDAGDLQIAINNGETNIVLMNDIVSDETIVIPAATTASYSLRSIAYALTIDLNGKTLSTVDKNVIRNDGTNVIIKNGTVSRSGTKGGYAINNVSGALAVEELTVVGGIFTNGPALSVTNSDISQYLSGRHGIYAYNCETTISNSAIHNNNSGNAAIMAAGSSVVTIDNSTVSIADGKATFGWTSCLLDCNGTASFVLNSGSFAGSIRVNSATSSATINGGTYSNPYGSTYIVSGSVTVNGGIFTDASSAGFAKQHLAEGFKAVENDGVHYVVPDGSEMVFNAAGLQTALDNAVDGTVILFGADITGNVVVTQKKDVDLIINGCGYKYNGVMTVFGNGKDANRTETLTIKNVNFVAAEGAESCIVSPDYDVYNVYSYSHNVTVDSCTFTDPDGVVDCAAIRQQDGGDENWSILSCTIDSTIHSLLQINNCEKGLTISGCTINSKNGVNLSSTVEVEIIGCNFDVQGYCVRSGAKSGGNPDVLKTITISGSTLKSANDEGDAVIIFRAGTKVANLTLTNTTLVGDPQFSGLTDTINVTIDGMKMIADGLCVDADGEYYIVSAAGLENLNAKLADKSLGQNVVVNLLSDIDFSGKTWTTVDSHVDFGTSISEINGNGHTISNMTINGQAMFRRFSGTGDVTIKDITFDNATANSNGEINTAILTVQSYQNLLLDNVDVKNSTISGAYKVASLVGSVYNENPSTTVTATLKNCDIENVTVKATSYDFCTAGMVAFVYEDDADAIVFENCTVTNVKLIAPEDSYAAHAAVYTAGSDVLYNEVTGVTVTNVTFEALN